MGSCFSRCSSQEHDDVMPSLSTTHRAEVEVATTQAPEDPSTTPVTESTKTELFHAIRVAADLEKVKRIINQHPSLLR